MTPDKEGLPSDRPSEEEEADTITRETSVAEAMGQVDIPVCVVNEDNDLLVTAESMASCRGAQTIAVVDDQGRLAGVIPMRLLVAELYLRVAPEEFLLGMRAFENIEEFGKISRAQTAGELMQPPVYVTAQDSARDAFVKMHETDLVGLPVVDEEMRVIGYLDRLQLMRLWLDKHRKWAEGRPGHGHRGQASTEGSV
ncbi:MAG: CBS domain-containing protein [Dehalococcoidia bacterium]|nr:MAG: CBS domain-containing protein [Dehalococcoidia bacterium]